MALRGNLGERTMKDPRLLQGGSLPTGLPGYHRSINQIPTLEVLEARDAAQANEMQNLFVENKRLAATLDTMRQDVLATRKEDQLIKAHIGGVQSEADVQAKGLVEKIREMEADVLSMEPLKKELHDTHMKAKAIVAEREQLVNEMKRVNDELQKVRAEGNKLKESASELEKLRQEHQNLRSTFEVEKSSNIKQVEQMRTMERNLLSMAGEVEKLRADVANAYKKVQVEQAQAAAVAQVQAQAAAAAQAQAAAVAQAAAQGGAAQYAQAATMQGAAQYAQAAATAQGAANHYGNVATAQAAANQYGNAATAQGTSSQHGNAAQGAATQYGNSAQGAAVQYGNAAQGAAGYYGTTYPSTVHAAYQPVIQQATANPYSAAGYGNSAAAAAAYQQAAVAVGGYMQGRVYPYPGHSQAQAAYPQYAGAYAMPQQQMGNTAVAGAMYAAGPAPTMAGGANGTTVPVQGGANPYGNAAGMPGLGRQM